MKRTVTILGCGSSGGVPRVGQGWGACDPNNGKNRRLRCSILVEQQTEHGATTRVLVDTSPDLRQQLLGVGADHLDAILVTHPHADHINGIDDVRPLVIKAQHRIAMHMDAVTAQVVRRGFSYIFETPPGSSYPPLLDEVRIESGRPIRLTGRGGPIEVTPFELSHGEIPALGFRFGRLAYTPDLSDIPIASQPFLADLDIWIVDALRYTPHPSHFSLEETLTWIDRLRPKRAILTNLHTDMDFDRLSAQLPNGVVPAFDGLAVTF